MELKVKITKDILRQAKDCIPGNMNYLVSENCAVALAIREVFPNASVNDCDAVLCKGTKDVYHDGGAFISKFDRSTPEQRLLLPETEVTIQVSDEVIEKIKIELPEYEKIIQESELLSL